MRKVLVILAVCSLLFACGSSDENKQGDEQKAGSPTARDPELEKGLEMIGASDCITCHKINEKNIGPAYTEVAQKYENTPAVVDTLAKKVIVGGAGVWGQIPMNPHPALSMDSARTMVKYILSLKNN